MSGIRSNASRQRAIACVHDGQSTHTLPRLRRDTVCIDGQARKITESVIEAARVVVYWPEVIFEKLIYFLHGAVEEWLR